MSTADAKTMAVYAAKVQDYVGLTAQLSPEQDIRVFVGSVPDNGHVLDLGCGPGHAAAMMKEAGLIVDAVDASPEMVDAAFTQFGVVASLANFSEIDAIEIYDGIFANFSLLHAPKSEFPNHLRSIREALKPKGILHLGMKTGAGEARDGLGRFYAYYTEEDLVGLLLSAGFSQTTCLRKGSAAGLAGSVEPYIIMRADA